MERRGATAPQTAPQTPLARAALVATVLLARRPADPVHQRQPTAARALGHVTAHSTQYTLSDIRAHADVVYLETSLQNSFAEALLSSKPLVMHFETFTNTLHQFAKNSSFDVHIARQFTRLN